MRIAEESTYEEIRARLKTGDLVLFSGRGALSRGIKRVTRSMWSHVGMVLYLLEEDGVWLWESTKLSTLKDHISGRRREGVQLVPLSQRLREYRGTVAIRLLDRPPTDDEYDRFNAFRRLVSRRPYERSYWELLRAAFGWNVKEDASSFFCSELVAESYQSFGWLTEAETANNYTPASFARTIPFVAGQAVGDLLQISRAA